MNMNMSPNKCMQSEQTTHYARGLAAVPGRFQTHDNSN